MRLRAEIGVSLELMDKGEAAIRHALLQRAEYAARSGACQSAASEREEIAIMQAKLRVISFEILPPDARRRHHVAQWVFEAVS